jgi:archaemetzincin
MVVGKIKIILLVFGTLSETLVPYVSKGLVREFGAEVVVGEHLPIPERAYDSQRRQYRAEAFLPPLVPWRRTQRDLVLGITTVDLYVPRLNFVFGLAEPGQRCAVISVARLDPQFFQQPPNPGLLQERALKEAVHELGHLLGLPHCQNPKCIMFFSNTLADTDRKGPGFCPACGAKIPGGPEGIGSQK